MKLLNPDHSLKQSACVVIERNGLFAVIRATKHGGTLELPGGKCEGSETTEDTARREVLEEVGVRLGRLIVLTVLDVRVPSTGTVHRCTVFAGRIHDSEQLKDGNEGPACWVTRADLLSDATYPDEMPEIFEEYDLIRPWTHG